VGIGTTTPTAKLTVAGTVQIVDGSQGSGKVLTSNTAGLASWQDIVSLGDSTPIGTVAAFNLAACPTGWIPSNGTSGTPDLRGEFIRGLDSGRGVDTGRVLGTAQIDLFKSHTHDLGFQLQTAAAPGASYNV
jgi:hypothetical protein